MTVTSSSKVCKFLGARIKKSSQYLYHLIPFSFTIRTTVAASGCLRLACSFFRHPRKRAGTANVTLFFGPEGEEDSERGLPGTFTIIAHFDNVLLQI